MSEQLFSASESVLVNDWSGLGWRPAVLIKSKPYSSRGRFITDGWEVQYTTEITQRKDGYLPSQGGWFPVNCIRKI